MKTVCQLSHPKELAVTVISINVSQRIGIFTVEQGLKAQMFQVKEENMNVIGLGSNRSSRPCRKRGMHTQL